jgi:hypothetical protein
MWEAAATTSSGQTRVLRVLEAGYPEEDWESLVHMSIGRRDQQLLKLREQVVEEHLTVVGECPQCQEAVELALSTRNLTAVGPDGEVDAKASARSHQFRHGGMVIEFRLPDSADLDLLAGYQDVEAARSTLHDRCVLSATASDGSSCARSELPSDTQEALEAEMDRLDPLAVTQFALVCPACRYQWLARLDLAEIVLAELTAEGRSLMRDVADLARHYHWSEQSILAMSSRRRRGYLELAGA